MSSDLPPPPTYEELFQLPSELDITATNTMTVTINGKTYTVDTSGADPDISPSTSLAHFIRNRTPFKGTKIACNEGGCGACSVMLEYTDLATSASKSQIVHACLRPLFSCNNMSVTTNDGLVKYDPKTMSHEYNVIQERLAKGNGSQCGYCSNGFVMTMHQFLKENPNATKIDVQNALDGNLCRCTGYRPIIDAFTSLVDKKGVTATEEHCEEGDCRKTGCKRRQQIWPDLEDMSKYIQHGEPLQHTPQNSSNVTPSTESSKKKVKKAPNTVAIQYKGDYITWEDCDTIAILTARLKYYNKPTRQYVMLVNGQTSLGVYPEDGSSIRLNIANIPEFKEITLSQKGIVIGSTVVINDVIHYLNKIDTKTATKMPYIPQLVAHLNRIAGRQIRGAGSLVGNLCLTHRHKSAEEFFCSDAATLMTGLNAVISYVDVVTDTSHEITMTDFFTKQSLSTLDGLYIQSILIPYFTAGADGTMPHFFSYKMAIRQVNSHALVNAAIQARVKKVNGVLTAYSAVVAIGGINSYPTLYTKIQDSMENLNITDTLAVQKMCQNAAAVLNPVSFMGREAFRKTTAVSFLYKFVLALNPSLSPSLASGAKCWMTKGLVHGTQEFQRNTAMYPVGAPFPKLESLQQTSGMAKYTEDVPTPSDMLHAVIVGIPQANAELKNIDFSEAEKVSGFVTFITAADIDNVQNSWQNGKIFLPVGGLSDYYDQPIGVVVARNKADAFAAASMIKCKYEIGAPPVVTLEEAMKGRPITPPPPLSEPLIRGDPDKALATAPKKVKCKVTLGYQQHIHMENHVCWVTPVESRWEVHASTQMPIFLQTQCALALKVPNSRVNVFNTRVGGGFGGKLTSSVVVAAICCLCAGKTGQAVCLTVPLRQTLSMLGIRGSKLLDYEAGVTLDGRILALKAMINCTTGAALTDEVGSVVVTMHSLDNAYYIPNAYINSNVYKTNTPAAAAVRGPGWVPGIGLSECIISHIAQELNLDPMVIREKNFLQKGQATVDGMILPYWNMQTIWSQLKEAAAYDKRRAEVNAYNVANRWTKRGLAMVPVRFGVGPTGANFDSLVNIFPDGGVGISHGGSEIGQGINTKCVQAVAYKLGIDMKFVSCDDTNSRRLSAGSNVTGGSVASELCVQSLLHACETLLRRIAPFRKPNVAWPEVIGNASAAGVDLSATGFTYAPVNGSGIFTYNSNAATVAEVEVDTLTGQFEVKKVDMLYDCGISMNPAIDIGQIEGGYMFGQGFYTQEEVSWDRTTGKNNNNSTWSYKIPAAADTPEQWNITLLKDAPNPMGVLSSKATGEPGVAMAVAVGQAIEDAVTAARWANGIEVNKRWVCNDYPLTVDKILEGCATNSDKFVV